MSTEPVVIVGAGLAGLSCARRLQETGVPWLLLDAADRIGGRLQTDVVEGFRLDRGFQVLLTAYPELRRLENFDTLNLRRFPAGARILYGDKWHTMADPRRHPQWLAATLAAPVGSWIDKLRVLPWAWRARHRNVDEAWGTSEVTALEALRRHGFGADIIESFWRPWLSGIFLERELTTSGRMLEFVIGMFAAGDAAIPADGVAALPRALAMDLPPERIRLGERVIRVTRDGVDLADGSAIQARRVVWATDGETAHSQLGVGEPVQWRSTTCVYFAADESPGGEGFLHLNGSEDGRVNHAVVLSDVAPSYAPDGQALIGASLIGEAKDLDDEMLVACTRQELASWWPGAAVARWRHLRTDRIRRALPICPPVRADVTKPVAPGLWVVGDHRSSPSSQGAMESGRLVAEVLRPS